MVFDEDRSQIRTGRGPQEMAACGTSPSAACGWPAIAKALGGSPPTGAIR